MSNYKDEFDLYPILKEWLEHERGFEVEEQVRYGRGGGLGTADIVAYDKHQRSIAVEVKISLAEAIPQALLCQDSFDYSYIAIPIMRQRSSGAWESNAIYQREIWALQRLGIGLFVMSNDNVIELIKAKKTENPKRKRLAKKLNRYMFESL